MHRSNNVRRLAALVSLAAALSVCAVAARVPAAKELYAAFTFTNMGNEGPHEWSACESDGRRELLFATASGYDNLLRSVCAVQDFRGTTPSASCPDSAVVVLARLQSYETAPPPLGGIIGSRERCRGGGGRWGEGSNGCVRTLSAISSKEPQLGCRSIEFGAWAEGRTQ
jgi:hypothetical protein